MMPLHAKCAETTSLDGIVENLKSSLRINCIGRIDDHNLK